MKKHAFLATVSLLLLILIMQQVQGLQNGSHTLSSSGTIKQQTLAVGVNYLSTWNTYSANNLNDDIIRRDFTQFQANGITTISLCLYWYRLEGNTQGSYNGTYPDGTYYGDMFLNNVKHIIETANLYGIKVLIDIHTLWNTNDSSWCTPKYVVDPVTGTNDGLAIVRSNAMRQAFINMFIHTVNYLAGTPGIWAWSILNEPWYWGRSANEHDFVTNNGQTQKENFITLIQELSSIIKAKNAGLVTVKFCNIKVGTDLNGDVTSRNLFVSDWNWDQRIFESLDFISFDAYIPTNPQAFDVWRNVTATNVLGASARNKQVWITEFGFYTANETEQADAYMTSLSLYASLPIDGCLAYNWNGNSISGSSSSYETWNICADPTTGQGTLAYNVLTSFNK